MVLINHLKTTSVGKESASFSFKQFMMKTLDSCITPYTVARPDMAQMATAARPDRAQMATAARPTRHKWCSQQQQGQTGHKWCSQQQQAPGQGTNGAVNSSEAGQGTNGTVNSSDAGQGTNGPVNSSEARQGTSGAESRAARLDRPQMVQSTAVSPDKAQMVQSAERERAIELLSLHKYIQYKYISSRMELELLAYKVEMQPRLSAVICISPFGQPHEPSAPSCYPC